MWSVALAYPCLPAGAQHEMNSTGGKAYGDDLAHIHDAGYGQLARCAAKLVVEELRAAGVRQGRIVDLGCGSGIAAERFVAAGYEALGIDQSGAMLRIARRRVPRATFKRGSIFSTTIPSCVAVTAMGEVLNYLFDGRSSAARLATVFRHIHGALPAGGILLCDVAEPGRVPGGGPLQHATEGNGWACIAVAEEDPARQTLERRITSFRRAGRTYRREFEVHRLRLYPRQQVARTLREVGFRVRVRRNYGDFRFPPGWAGFLARKR